MSLFSISAKKNTAFYDNFVKPKPPGTPGVRTKDRSEGETTTGSTKGNDTTTLNKTREVNRTYVISNLSKGGEGGQTTPGTPAPRGRPTLQRRKTGAENRDRDRDNSTTMSENNTQNNSTPSAPPEKRLTLQRRTRTGSIDKSATNNDQISKATTEKQHRSTKVLSESNARSASASVSRSVSLKDTSSSAASKSQSKEVDKSKSQSKEVDKISLLTTTPGRGGGGGVVEKPVSRFPLKQPTTPFKRLVAIAKQTEDTNGAFPLQGQPGSKGTTTTYSTPTRKTPFENITAKKEVFERWQQASKAVVMRSASLERPRNTHDAQVAVEEGGKRIVVPPRVNKFMVGVVQTSTLHTPAQVRHTSIKTSSITTTTVGHGGDVSTQARKHSTTTTTTTGTTAAPPPVATEPLVRPSGSVLVKQDSLKMENSAVTVAVRVRPFNLREKAETGLQVIFMDGQETVVQHPDTKQSYSFTYDFSFCSVHAGDPGFASQQTVYEKLAQPLLERAFEGFNTCLFAYGQTGSGKSYTMMGFGEEAGVTPRFCEELFSRVSAAENQEVTCHLEMSFFEVYNEKIHDLLVARDEQNQKRAPLRVREHPVHGPYVEELSTNVVSSFADIQGWLELGNKQRATAATGMNDKSSRSHSVFTLVMTQTKTECVEGEQHDHCITSRMNLVDLAGSERCSSAQTSGERLREGASINKSLLTLGKVISALSEQAQTRRTVFTPYRESVLTWLLKESLGGNSKTAMIATLSPAGSSVEESLSTLRYAQQARLIINTAKVNEDTNAKLIRELKAEVEKLRAAQQSAQGAEPQKVRLFQQEITALRGQLSQQEREMAAAHRAWREKLEQAERRKREETKELQKAGVTFKVDNRLPNLVNLNEDPQLSEMLLYMIKEGQTRVGRLTSDSAHDIQLAGALIADQHCVISNVSGTVSLSPLEDGKTFVNGALLSEPAVLNHGDRVILGGDHYFRFNHPAQVQSGKRVSCWGQGSGDGQMKDFEFAKYELLSAQRAQLEAEIQEARLKAKEEMMQGIQVAKEMAQKELSDQKTLYEDKIRALEGELEEEAERKRRQEAAQVKVASQVEQLQTAKSHLEQEVDAHKTRLRLHMEAQATRQAMADHNVRQAKIVEALEAEKMKISRDVEEMQRRIALRETHRTPKHGPPQWDAMKLSLMIEEANKISTKLRKDTVFSRHEGSEKEGEGEGGVLVQNAKLGISTVWTLEKLQSNMAAMRELDQGDVSSRDDDVFYDPNDEWEQDLSVSSTSSSFSRRRSRSLLKGRRISGRLYEIRVHPIQSLNRSSQSSGLMGVAKPPSLHPSTSDSALPGICKDLIGQTVARLRAWDSAEESVADRLTFDLHCVYTSLRTICSLYDGLDDNSQDSVFACSVEAQTQLVRATSAIDRAVLVTMQWLAAVRPSSGHLYTCAEDLKTQVKRMGGFFQLLIQGCDSEISSMVTEAQRRSAECLEAALRLISRLAAMSGTLLHVTEMGADAAGKRAVGVSLLQGTSQGVHSLLQMGLTLTNDLLREAQLAYPRTPVLQSLKSKMLDLSCALQRYIHCNMTEREDSSEEPVEEADPSLLHSLRATAARLFQLTQAIRQLHASVSACFRGKGSESSLSACRESISSASRTIDEVINGLGGAGGASGLQLPCVQNVMAARDDLHAALLSLGTAFDQTGAAESSRGGSTGSEKSEGGSAASSSSALRNRAATPSAVLHSLSSGGSSWGVLGGSSSNGEPRWV